MPRSPITLVCAVAALVAARRAAQTPSPPLGIGRPATAEDIRVLDIDVIPDGLMDQSSLPKVRMPARDRFVPDNRRGSRDVK